MDSALLRNLGVNEAIIQALQKSYGEGEGEFEILQDKHDLRLLVKNNRSLEQGKIQIFTLLGFFDGLDSQKRFDLQDAPPARESRCEDVFEFLPEDGALSDNLKINDVSLHLCVSLLKPLRYLAQKKVDTKSGWAYIQDMKTDGVIPSEGYQLFSRIRAALAGYLINKNGKHLIEANGRKQYRLALDPGNIKFTETAI
jgi:hypothetical protein